MQKTSSVTWLVLNAASGSNAADSARSLSDALATAGRRLARTVDVQTDGLPTREQLEAAKVDLLVVFGGDGTANAIVKATLGWSGAVLVLPGGTANLLSRALHGDADAETVIDRLRKGALAPVRRTGIACAGTVAVIEVLAGPGATWSDVREELRARDPVRTAESVIAATRESAGGAPVHIVEPPLGRSEGYPGVRMAPHGDRMAVYGYGPKGVVDFIKQGVALLRRDFREGPHDELGEHSAVVCRSADATPIELMIDGERATGASQERFELVPLDVDLLAACHG